MSHSITIAGKPYNVEARFAEGHVLTANEASALNQTFFENLRNNFAGKAKEGGEGASQEAFDAYAASYQFGVRTGGGGSRDPIEVEAMSIARDTVKDMIRKAGKKLSDYSATAISETAGKLLAHEVKGPEIRELAKKRVAEMQSAAGQSVDLDLLSGLEAKPTEEADASGAAPTRKGKAA